MDSEKQRTATANANELLTIGQVAALLGKPVSTIRSWFAAGVLPSPAIRKRGAKMQWHRGTVEAWAQGQETKQCER